MDQNTKLTDEELMILYAHENSMEAFAILFKRYEKKLHSFFNYKAPFLGKQIRDEFFQKTWLNIHENRKKFDSAYKFSSWHYQIALNILRDHLKGSAHKSEIISDDLSYFDSGESNLEESIIQKSEIKNLEPLFNELTDMQRKVFKMHEVEEMDYDLIATKLNLTQETVRQHLSRAKKKLKEAIEEQEKKNAT